MKIIHLASGDLWAGAEVQLFHLAKALARDERVTLKVILLNHGRLENELMDYGVSVQVLDESVLSFLSIVRKFNGMVKDFNPDIIHTHRAKENIIGGLVAKFRRVASIRTVHGDAETPVKFYNLKQVLIRALDKFSAVFFQIKIIAVSSGLKSKLSKIYPEKKINVIENCIDEKYVIDASSKRCAYKLEEGCFHVAFVGRFVPVKRPDIFYDVARQVISLYPDKNIHFHMLGDGPLRNVLMEQIEKNNLSEKLHLYGFVANVPPLLKQMDLLMFTSDSEGLPMTLLEAMILKVPVISRDLPSIKHVLCDGGCGCIIESALTEEYCARILEVANNGREARIKAGDAENLIHAKYNIKANLDNYLNLYMKILNSRRQEIR